MDLLHLARTDLRRGARLVFLGALLGGAVGCDDPVPTPELHGQVHLTTLHTSDIHSRLYPYDIQLTQTDSGLGLGANGEIINTGGDARVSHIIGRERARADRVLHLDGGDSFQGAPIFNFFSGEPEVRALSAMGTDVSLVANHEFDRGALNLGIQLQKWATYPVLAANYLFEDPSTPGASPLGGIVKPFTVFDVEGLKVGVIGMGNLSSLGSIYTQPNRLGITPLDTIETAQFYVDLLRPSVDVIIVLSHLGLEVDEQMIEGTSGIDLVLGGHNHIVLQPPKQLLDCQAYTERNRNGDDQHFILLDAPGSGQQDVGCHTDADCGFGAVCVGLPLSVSMGQALCKIKRPCTPRNVILSHSGAFAKYVGRLDLILSNAPEDLPPTYDKLDGFEIISNEYNLLPVTDQTPADPVVTTVLEPYQQTLDAVGNLNLLVGYALDGSQRIAKGGGDSPLGNLIATAMWVRPGIQTDFSLTNTTGIRTDLVPGPVTIEQMYNIFPFDNSITKMSLSGVEVQELFDYIAQRSAGRGCDSQAQIAGARVVMNCNILLPYDQSQGNPGHATNIYIGTTDQHCASDVDCREGSREGTPNQCDTKTGLCWQPIAPLGSYQLATSDYLSHGGSGFLVLQRNTTQNNTRVEQRDALIDYLQNGFPCGSDDTGKLKACSTDNDCAEINQNAVGQFVCACPGSVTPTPEGTQCLSTLVATASVDLYGGAKASGSVVGTIPAGATVAVLNGVEQNGFFNVVYTSPTGLSLTGWALASEFSNGCAGKGQCVLAQCRDDVAAIQVATCQAAPTNTVQAQCEASLNPCVVGGETCKFLACVDQRLGNLSDNRIEMVGQ